MTPSLLLAFAGLFPACSGQALDVGSDGQAGRATSGSNAAGEASGSSAGGPTTSGSSAGGTTTSAGGTTTSASAGTSSSMAGTGPSEELPPVVSPWPDSSCEAGAGNPFEGTWNGYAQGQGHNDDFTLVLGGTSEAPCGTITFGEPMSYPPATDPEAPPADYASFKPTPRSPGFTYTILAAEVDGSRLQFRIAHAEAYASWCALQTSYPSPQGGFACLPSYGDGVRVENDSCYATGSTAQGHVYTCSHYFACLGVFDKPCACQAGGCVANIDGEGERFDLNFDETEASGLMRTKTVLLEKE